MVVVNAFGDVRDAHGEIIAGARRAKRRVRRHAARARVGRDSFAEQVRRPQHEKKKARRRHRERSTQTESERRPRRARGKRALFSAHHTGGRSFDGDVVFAVSPMADEVARIEAIVIESLAVAALKNAVERAVPRSRPRGGPGLADTHGAESAAGRGRTPFSRGMIRAPIAPMHGEPRIAARSLGAGCRPPRRRARRRRRWARSVGRTATRDAAPRFPRACPGNHRSPEPCITRVSLGCADPDGVGCPPRAFPSARFSRRTRPTSGEVSRIEPYRRKIPAGCRRRHAQRTSVLRRHQLPVGRRHAVGRGLLGVRADRIRPARQAASRDASQQAQAGEARHRRDRRGARAGELLFFPIARTSASRTSARTGDTRMVHLGLGRGGYSVERLDGPGGRLRRAAAKAISVRAPRASSSASRSARRRRGANLHGDVERRLAIDGDRHRVPPGESIGRSNCAISGRSISSRASRRSRHSDHLALLHSSGPFGLSQRKDTVCAPTSTPRP